MKKLLALVAVFALVTFAAPAFAANPFVDVPMNHWAYDAISQLAAKGIIQGYPDGTYRGNHPMTRYEMSMLVARALATVDMEKASKEDVEMLKKLVVEFKDELEALGVRVDALDERVAVLEENLGGWKFFGEVRFDARWSDKADGAYANSDHTTAEQHQAGDTEFDTGRFYFWFFKQMDEKTSFTARLDLCNNDNADVQWWRYFVTIAPTDDSFMWIGLWWYDWEADAGLYIGDVEDAWFTNQCPTGFYYSKRFAKGDLSAFLSHNEDSMEIEGSHIGGATDNYNYGLRMNLQMNDKFRIALTGIWYDYDNDGVKTTKWTQGAPRYLYDMTKNATEKNDSFEYGLYDSAVYWTDFTLTFTPGFDLRGVYFVQDHDGPSGSEYSHFDDSPNAYKLVLDVSQDVLKFTRIWLEYAKIEPYFRTAIQPWDTFFAVEVTPMLSGPAVANVWEREIVFVRLEQKWSDKWSTFQRFGQYNHDIEDYASHAYGGRREFDVSNWSLGVQYWYTPNVKFELAYDNVDYDDGWQKFDEDLKDDHLLRFRTHFFF
ncbi:putative S-layer protein [Acetomicrobium mobile DSM 13181]|uniref:Putative S-layer protein n=1 Tax=Acetomicrobium mobile (strain ATCC BAA-54 / DSM 13181 / JCM 12221 / NGA) TaxID=891968 RepID=I4BZ10_ACEMN|nr:S-layer homology domain-containing protein [Acetomicrobium mobile]AFM22517.1 putative S-layer protein [Acetomicrobium mobile DSM 13181]